jgi:hypothetical protein
MQIQKIFFSTGHFNLFDIEPQKSATATKNRPKNMKIRGQAFGVGAYEEDDEDIYGKDDMSNYDFSLPTEKVSSLKGFTQTIMLTIIKMISFLRKSDVKIVPKENLDGIQVHLLM